MKANTIYLFLLFLLITTGCSEEVIEPIDIEDQVTLTFPLSTDKVQYCCFKLEWESTVNGGEYQVQISENINFDALLFDTLVKGTSLEFPSMLIPDHTYFWRVIPEKMENSQASLFQIIDYVELLSGSYEATINIYRWSMGQTVKDTTHQTTLYIAIGNEENSLGYTTDHEASIYNMPFVDRKNDSFVMYELHDPHPTHNNYLKYYFDTDSIYIYSQSYGNGGGGHHSIKAKRE